MGDLVSSIIAIAAIYIGSFVLHVVLPVTNIAHHFPKYDAHVAGYARGADGKVLRYRLNGVAVLVLFVAAFIGLALLGQIDGKFFYTNFWECLLSSSVFGLLFSFYFYIQGPFPNPVSAPKVIQTRKKLQKSPLLLFLHDFFFGYELNPRWSLFPDFDIKMHLYLAGALLTQVNVISAIFAHYEQNNSQISWAVTVYGFEMSWFLVEYLFFEHVHLYTYDLIDENVGFKLAWGCLCFYSFFYPAGIFPIVPQGHEVPFEILVTSLILFFLGYTFSRGANLQKYYFKIAPKESFLGTKPKSLDGRLLYSGFWGLSRHINYLGEVLMASGIALSAGFYSPLPWLYPLYYVALLITREWDDDVRCALKYKSLWKDYKKRVPYRIIPFIY